MKLLCVRPLGNIRSFLESFEGEGIAWDLYVVPFSTARHAFCFVFYFFFFFSHTNTRGGSKGAVAATVGEAPPLRLTEGGLGGSAMAKQEDRFLPHY